MKEKDILEKILKWVKVLTILVALVTVILSIGISKLLFENNSTSTNTTSSESEYNTKYDVSMFEEIEAKEVNSKTKNKLSVIYIGRESCGWCAAFLPNLWDAQEEYGFKTMYIDLAKIIDFSNGNVIDKDSYDILTKLSGKNYDGYMKENFGATPMILIVKNNEIVEAQTGYSDYETFKQLLEKTEIKNN